MPTKSKSRHPKAPAILPDSELARASSFKPCDEDLYTRILIEHCSCPGASAEHVIVEESVFDNVNLTETRLKRLDISDTEFRNCDIANAAWDDFEARRVLFNSCRILGAKFIEAIFKDAQFSDSHAQFAQFRYCELSGASFIGCDLRDADFSGANLGGVTFDGCDLTRVSFLNANCDGADFRTSSIEGIGIGAAELRGAIVTPIQAVMLAAVFGLTVLNEHDDIDDASREAE